MRLSSRLVLAVALLLGGVTLEPVATASADTAGGATPVATGSASPSGSADPGTSSAAGSSAPAESTGPTASSSTPASGASSSASTTRSSTAAAPRAATAAPDVRIDSTGPAKVAILRKATFRYSSSNPLARFKCRLKGPGISKPALKPCGGALDPKTGRAAGSISYTGHTLRASRSAWTFTVQSYLPAVGTTPLVTGAATSRGWRIFTVYSPHHVYPHSGPTFNRPLSSWNWQNHNLMRVINTINSMPGYKEANPGLCPSDPKLWPSKVRISLYSMFSDRFRRAAEAASKRCVSVQVLMNNHLNRKNDFAWRHLENALHTRISYHGRVHRSFARRCPYGCRGRGVLHTKMYLFDSTLPVASKNRIKKTVMMGSSNITPNAAHTQWNDLYGKVNDSKLFGQYERVFNLMRRLKRDPRLLHYSTGPYSTYFWPQGRSHDPMLSVFSPVRCTGVNGGAGSGGRTTIYVNMHAWFGTRGEKLANQVRSLYNRGCRVHVLYSFMSYGVYKKLHKGTGSRMSVRRTAFSHNGYNAYVYSHFKNILISGRYGSDRSAWLTWTGSNNFTNDGTRFDEAMMRISSRSVYGKYRNQFSYMTRRLSAPGYTLFHEPSGGGRPKRALVMDNTGADVWRTQPTGPTAPAGTPTVTSDTVTVDSNGVPHALD